MLGSGKEEINIGIIGAGDPYVAHFLSLLSDGAATGESRINLNLFESNLLQMEMSLVADDLKQAGFKLLDNIIISTQFPPKTMHTLELIIIFADMGIGYPKMGEEIGEHYPNARILIVGEPRAEVMKAIYGEANKISPDHITGLCLDKFNKGIYNLGANEEEVLTRILSIADCPHSLKQIMTEKETGEEELESHLTKLAEDVRKNAWADYSKFQVGAAFTDNEGRIWTGANIENASYGLTNCAERTGIQYAVAHGMKKLGMLVVTGNTDGPIYPCGACRQVINEFSDERTRIICKNIKGETNRHNINQVLPNGFGRKDLEFLPKLKEVDILPPRIIGPITLAKALITHIKWWRQGSGDKVFPVSIFIDQLIKLSFCLTRGWFQITPVTTL